MQFLLNGVLYTDEGPLSPDSDEEEEEEEEEDSNKGHFSLEYVEDPQFFTANKEKLIKHHPGEPLTLIINVSDADSPGTSCFQRLYIIILCVVDIKDVKIRHIILLAFKIFKPPPATSQHTKWACVSHAAQCFPMLTLFRRGRKAFLIKTKCGNEKNKCGEETRHSQWLLIHGGEAMKWMWWNFITVSFLVGKKSLNQDFHKSVKYKCKDV